MMWAWYVTSYYSQLVAGCCSQWSWKKGTDHPERDTHCLSGQPVPSHPLMDGSVLTMIWHRWRHWSLHVYSRCPIPPQRLENTSVVTAGIKALARFFQCVMAMKRGNHYRNLDNPEAQRCAGEGEGGGTSSRLQRCARSARALSYCAAPALPADTHFIPQEQPCEGSGQAQLPVWAPLGSKPLTGSDRWLKHPTTKQRVQGPHLYQVASQAWITADVHWNRNAAAVPSLQVSLCMLLLQALQSWTAQQSWSSCTKRVLLLHTNLFFSHTSPRYILWPQKLLLWTRTVFLTSSIALSTCWVPASTHLTWHS